MTINYSHSSLTHSPFIMSKSVMLSLLSRGNTGAEILQILDTLAEDNQQSFEYTEPTADVIEF